MARCKRDKAESGIYHVMMRGINRQNIFIDELDRIKFLEFMQKALIRSKNLSGNDAGVYEIYAYALMGNHFHILIKVISGELGEFVKKVASSYVMYFNKKYGRDGHLFKERFKSEICDKEDYFKTLLRYIHQNPIKDGFTTDLLRYRYTSWNEYVDPEHAKIKICNVDYVLSKISLEELTEMVYDLLPGNQKCIDVDKRIGHIGDDSVIKYLSEKYAITDDTQVKKLDSDSRSKLIVDLLDFGATVCQIERLTGIDKGRISRLKKRMSQ